MAATRMKKLLLLSVSGLAICAVGCNELEGRVQINEAIQLKSKKKMVTVEPGSYGAQIDFPKKDKARLEIRRKGRKNNVEAIFNIGTRYFPRYNGPIDIPATENGQPYNLKGFMKTDVSETTERWGTESCSTVVRERYCERDRRGRYYCRYVDRVVTGHSQVRYFDRITEQFLELNLEDTHSRHLAAEANGQNTTTERIVTYREPCRYYGYHHPYYP